MPEDYGTPTPPPPPPVQPVPPTTPYEQAPPGMPYGGAPGYGTGYRQVYGPGYGRGYGYGMVPPPARRSPWFYVAVIGGSLAGLFLLVMAMVWSVGRAFRGGDESQGFGLDGGSRIAVIDVTGVILSPETISGQLRKFGDDSTVKAILLHINSPGGDAAASQELYNEVLRVREQNHKKVIASVESVGASGAYYVASACDKIYANNASVVGSIGVIMEWTNYGDLMRWAKLKNVAIHAGELKDAGDPSRDLTPKEEAYFQSLVDNMYGQFVHDVATARHTSDEKIRPLATGQVWTGQQALPLGLIDKVGGYRVALMDTAKAVGIQGEPTVVRPAKAKKGLLAALTGDADDLFPNPSQLLNRAPGFYFLWK